MITYHRNYNYILILPFLLFFVRIFLLNVIGSWEYDIVSSHKYIYKENIITQLSLIGALFFLIVSFVLNRKEFNYYVSKYIRFYFLIVLAIAFLFTCNTFLYEKSGIGMVFAFTQDAYNPLYYILFLGVVASFNDEVFLWIRKIALFFALFFVLYSIYILFSSVNSLLIFGLSPVLRFMATAFWLFILASFTDENISFKKYMICLIGLFLCTCISFIIISRSWIIQGTLAISLLTYYYFNRSRYKLLFIALIVTVLWLAIPYFYSMYVESDSFDYFLNKLYRDSRSSQYIEVFSQFPPYAFLIGLGQYASYNSPAWGAGFRYIDNQTVLSLYRYGIIPTLFYYVFVFFPAVKVFFKKKKFRLMAWGIFMWCMAINGLSVYNGLDWDISNYVTILLVGRCLYVLKKEDV